MVDFALLENMNVFLIYFSNSIGTGWSSVNCNCSIFLLLDTTIGYLAIACMILFDNLVRN